MNRDYLEMFKLTGKVAVITGGVTGLGKEIAKAYVSAGASVVITGRRQDVLNEAASEIASNGGAVLAVPADTKRHEDVDNVADRALKEFGRVDILVNNAGIND